MARIRTIKPDFFKHWELYQAEIETGLPLRVAFAGIWTICDREGRFKWVPPQIKIEILPYDECDFSRVLHALATRGFIKKYTSNGVEYGVVPGFKTHQVINARESASILPSPDDESSQDIDNNEELTRNSRVDDASVTGGVCARGEGKGREGKGRSLSSSGDDARTAFDRYNEMAGRSGLPIAQMWSDTRRKHIAARLDDAGGIEGWCHVLEKIEASDFLTGKANGWKASLDWITNKTNFTKILEGNYDNRASGDHTESEDDDERWRREQDEIYKGVII